MDKKKAKQKELGQLMTWHFKQIDLVNGGKTSEVHHQHFCSLSDEGNRKAKNSSKSQ